MARGGWRVLSRPRAAEHPERTRGFAGRQPHFVLSSMACGVPRAPQVCESRREELSAGREMPTRGGRRAAPMLGV